MNSHNDVEARDDNGRPWVMTHNSPVVAGKSSSTTITNGKKKDVWAWPGMQIESKAALHELLNANKGIYALRMRERGVKYAVECKNGGVECSFRILTERDNSSRDVYTITEAVLQHSCTITKCKPPMCNEGLKRKRGRPPKVSLHTDPKDQKKLKQHTTDDDDCTTTDCDDDDNEGSSEAASAGTGNNNSQAAAVTAQADDDDDVVAEMRKQVVARASDSADMIVNHIVEAMNAKHKAEIARLQAAHNDEIRDLQSRLKKAAEAKPGADVIAQLRARLNAALDKLGSADE